MRLTHGKGIRRDFINDPSGKDIVAEHDIKVTGGARLAAKLLIFEHPKALRRFWREAIGGDLGKGCLGAVNGLACEVIMVKPGKPDRHRIEVDPRYFCVIGLCQTHLSMEIICHESTHAGLQWAKRAKRNFWCSPGELDEENVCYPTGRIAAAINRFVWKKGLYV